MKSLAAGCSTKMFPFTPDSFANGDWTDDDDVPEVGQTEDEHVRKPQDEPEFRIADKSTIPKVPRTYWYDVSSPASPPTLVWHATRGLQVPQDSTTMPTQKLFPVVAKMFSNSHRRTELRIPTSNTELIDLLVKAARNAAAPKNGGGTVGPYNARCAIMQPLFVGSIPKTVDAHEYQVQLLRVIFSESGPLSDNCGQMKVDDIAKPRTVVFFSKVAELATLVSRIVDNVLQGWDKDIVKRYESKEKAYSVSGTNKDARYEDWSPLFPVHRVIYATNGRNSSSFVSELLQEYTKGMHKELFATDYYKLQIQQMSAERDRCVNNDESRAKHLSPHKEYKREKKCDQRRAYPIAGPLEYHVYKENQEIVEEIAAYFDAEKYTAICPLPPHMLEKCETLCAAVGLQGRQGTQEFAQSVSKQHHFDQSLKRASFLFGECFQCLVDKSKCAIHDLEVRNGLFVITAMQSNIEKTSEKANDSNFWLLKLIHSLLKIQDGRLNERNYVNETELPVVDETKKHIDGGVNKKILDCICRIEVNMVALIVEKVCSYFRLRYQAFKNSNRLEGHLVDIEKIEGTNPKRECLLHTMNIHKGDAQSAVTAYMTRQILDNAAKRKRPSHDMTMALNDAPVSDESSASDHEMRSMPAVGSVSERTNLEVVCQVIEGIFKCYDPTSISNTSEFVICGDETSTTELNQFFNDACRSIGWIALKARALCDDLRTRCEALLETLRCALNLCRRIEITHSTVSPIYADEHKKEMEAQKRLQNKPLDEMTISDIALNRMSSADISKRAYTVALDKVQRLQTLSYPAKGLVKCMLGAPDKWASLMKTNTKDKDNLEEAMMVIDMYKEAISSAQTDTFFDFTMYLERYIKTLTAYKNVTNPDDRELTNGEGDESIGLKEHCPPKTDILFVRTRLLAFSKQRDEWNKRALESIRISFLLSGSWAGLDEEKSNMLPEGRLTHKKPGLSAIMYMLTICHVENVLLVTSDEDEFKRFRSGATEGETTYLMAVCTTPGRRNIAIAPLVKFEAFATTSTDNWNKVCCLVYVAFFVLAHARNKHFSMTNTIIPSNACMVFFHDDEQFVHVHEQNGNAAVEKIQDMKKTIHESYPSSYNWQLSDETLTAARINVFTRCVPSMLNNDTGSINLAGVKDRPPTNHGMFKISEAKMMPDNLDRLYFTLFFEDDDFGTSATPGTRMEVDGSCSSSKKDPLTFVDFVGDECKQSIKSVL